MVYILEDDDSIRELVLYTLAGNGFEAKGFSCGKDFWKKMKEEIPDLILLDIMFPDADGLQILRRIRETEEMTDIAVVMMTAKGSEYDKVLGLDAGADDYIAKPFGMMELVARVRAHLRRQERKSQNKSQEERILSCGKITIDLEKHLVHVKEEEVQLTYKEFEVLSFLMEHESRVISREQLMERVWGYQADCESRTVDVHMRTLRQKLGEAGEQIKTIRGVGYKIEADL